MRYRTLGKTGLKVSILGFGCMRLPEKGGRVDRDLAIPMLRRAVELGINFFDTATMYCNHDSQAALGEAMEGRRDRVILSTKNPLRGVTPAQWRAKLEESLRLLRTDHIDVYHHHGANWKDYEDNLDPAKGGLTAEMLKAKAEGLIRHAAFSFHDKPENLIRLADTGHYESVIAQYNLLDQANADALAHCHAIGMGVVIMGPVGGGRLGLPSERIRELTGAGSTVEAALRFVWAHPGVDVALSGMQTMAMLEENARLADVAGPFTAEEVTRLNALVAERKQKSGLYCSGCRYCLEDCPEGLPIPDLLETLNLGLVYGLDEHARNRFNQIAPGPANCIACGKCVLKCPQKIDIPVRLREVAAMFDPTYRTVRANFRLDRLGSDGAFAGTLRLHNFHEQATPVSLRLEPGAGTVVEAPAKPPGELGPFRRHQFALKGKSAPEAKRIQFVNRIAAHGKETTVAVDYQYLRLPAGITSDWESGDWHAFAAKPEDFSAAQETVPLHRARFRLGRDERTLDLHLEVEDDFLYPSREDRDAGNLVDTVELFLDGRKPEALGRSNHETGVFQVFLYPGTPGTHPAFVHPKDKLKMEIAAEPFAKGYRLVARIPFAGFCQGPVLPKVFAIDLAIDSADQRGGRIGQYVFAGSKENWRVASGYRQVWVV